MLPGKRKSSLFIEQYESTATSDENKTIAVGGGSLKDQTVFRVQTGKGL